MKIQTRIFIGYFASALLVLGLGLSILFAIQTVGPVVDDLERGVDSLGRAVSLSRLSARIVSLRTELARSAYNVALTRDRGYALRYERDSLELSETFEHAIRESDDEDDRTVFRNLEETSQRLETWEREMMSLADNNMTEEARKLAQSPDYVQLSEAISDFTTTLANTARSHSRDEFSRLIDVSVAAQETRQNLETVLVVTSVSVGVILCTSIIIGALVARSIARPLAVLREGAVAIGKGNLEYRIGLHRRDEIGVLSDAFDGMAAKLCASREELASGQRRLETHVHELARSNQELEEFAYVASHDLKAPLRAINSLSQWIEEDLGELLEGQPRENMQLLRARVSRLGRLLDDLLTYSRMGRSKTETETVDTGTLVRSIIDMVEAPPGMVIDISDEMTGLETNRGPLEHVFGNLITNAIVHHDRDTGRMKISAQNRGAFYEFSVKDDGPGIPPELHDKAFRMFQTLRPRDEQEGSGIGLAIVKRLVEQNGGKVRIDSRSGSRGTAVLFEWPTPPPRIVEFDRTSHITPDIPQARYEGSRHEWN